MIPLAHGPIIRLRMSQRSARESPCREKPRVVKLPESPGIAVSIEHPDQVITIFRPALGHCVVIANDKVTDSWDVLMLPADENDTISGKRIPYQSLLLALREIGQWHQSQPFGHRCDRFKRTPTVAANR